MKSILPIARISLYMITPLIITHEQRTPSYFNHLLYAGKKHILMHFFHTFHRTTHAHTAPPTVHPILVQMALNAQKQLGVPERHYASIHDDSQRETDVNLKAAHVTLKGINLNQTFLHTQNYGQLRHISLHEAGHVAYNHIAHIYCSIGVGTWSLWQVLTYSEQFIEPIPSSFSRLNTYCLVIGAFVTLWLKTHKKLLWLHERTADITAFQELKCYKCLEECLAYYRDIPALHRAGYCPKDMVEQEHKKAFKQGLICPYHRHQEGI